MSPASSAPDERHGFALFENQIYAAQATYDFLGGSENACDTLVTCSRPARDRSRPSHNHRPPWTPCWGRGVNFFGGVRWRLVFA
eukprot:gene10922-biopygen6229